MKLSRILVAAAAAGALALGPTTAASAVVWHPIEGHDGLVLATCADGSQILSGATIGRYAETPVLDADGTMTGLVLMLKYSLEFVHSTTGQVIDGTGNSRIVFDFVDGVHTDTGNYRTVTMAGEGWVLKEAGRGVFSLEDGALLDFDGVFDGDAAQLCPYFGVGA